MKKIFKIIGIVILVIIVIVKNIIASKLPWLSDNYYKDSVSNSNLEKRYSGLWDYEVSSVEYKVDDKYIWRVRLWHLKELETTDKTYPMIVVANASNVKALNLKASFKRLASWGFIVIYDSQSGNGETTSKTLDYVLDLDSDSVLYNKIDKDNIGIIGYSQGETGALRTVTEYENSKYYKTIFTGSAAYSTLAKNLGWGLWYF